MHTTTKFLLTCLSLPVATISLLAADKSAKEHKPNVLFIAIDDMTDWVGCLGNYPHIHTPNIDRLAQKGILFTNAHCQAPLSGPSRASLMSGLYPHTSGVYMQVDDQFLKEKSKPIEAATFLPDYFEQFGYSTAAAGKLYHRGDNAHTFDRYAGCFPNNTDRRRSKKPMNYHWSWFSSEWKTMTDWGPLDIEDSDMPDYQTANFGISELKLKHSKPFFLAVGFTLPHTPWQLPKKWFDMFPEDEMVLPPYKSDDLDDVPAISREIHNQPQMPKAEWLLKTNKWKSLVQSYLASIAFVDAQVGRVLDALEASEYADNTIVILYSDHGYHIGEKNRVCKHSLWNRSTHVPLIFAGGDIKPKSKCHTPVGLIDIYPTLVDLCGLDKNVQNEGGSLTPLMRNPESTDHHPAISSYGKGNTSVYSENYHLIQYEDGTQELYDMEKDPNEWTNLALKPAYSKVIKKLVALLPAQYAEYVGDEGINPFFNKKIAERDAALK